MDATRVYRACCWSPPLVCASTRTATSDVTQSSCHFPLWLQWTGPSCTLAPAPLCASRTWITQRSHFLHSAIKKMPLGTRSCTPGVRGMEQTIPSPHRPRRSQMTWPWVRPRTSPCPCWKAWAASVNFSSWTSVRCSGSTSGSRHQASLPAERARRRRHSTQASRDKLSQPQRTGIRKVRCQVMLTFCTLPKLPGRMRTLRRFL
mmetsp:Transcript_33492/g.84073  ORF Transcript_33492/g.84073 Transcript_33492/m.84073 type:complete len:204 (+) Transcript_33492:783-1394(+)